jgi:hypothetical protein
MFEIRAQTIHYQRPTRRINQKGAEVEATRSRGKKRIKNRGNSNTGQSSQSRER